MFLNSISSDSRFHSMENNGEILFSGIILLFKTFFACFCFRLVNWFTHTHTQTEWLVMMNEHETFACPRVSCHAIFFNRFLFSYSSSIFFSSYYYFFIIFKKWRSRLCMYILYTFFHLQSSFFKTCTYI